MSVTDVKPLLPENVTNLFVEFSEVWVHKSGEGWRQLNLVESPYGVKFNDIDTEDANKLKKILPEKFQNFSYENYMQ